MTKRRSAVTGGVMLLLALLLLSSCSQEWPHARVVRGNYNVSRGEYQRAIVDYLRAREEQQYEPWIAYNLGNVYHFLGEADAALDQWDIAQQTDVADLQFGAGFNRGVYLFEQGRYAEALPQFRFALRIDPTSVAAKRNYELTLTRMNSGSGLSGDAQSAEQGETQEADTPESTATRMLDYIRRKEEQQWRANAERELTPEEQDW
ncbi:MAG: tetratricopeptide repeat protein [Spirochaeta sp.]|jgi:tetratricopeptide (TPR) repeat protein|nr:tetratricopeptide repeat protein [Spirochaeta sp.]